jgi:hypothetical protein
MCCKWYLGGKSLVLKFCSIILGYFFKALVQQGFFVVYFDFVCIKIILFKFWRLILCIMTPPKLLSNFKCKALFGSRFLAFVPQPFAFESPQFEALNHLHLGFNSNVASCNNTITIAIVIDLEQDFELQKYIMKRWKFELDHKFQDV